MTTELKPLLRTPKGCYKLHTSDAWGKWYKQIDDPKGVDVDPAVLRTFTLTENFPKVPISTIRKIVSFYRHYITSLAPTSRADTNEVQVLLLRKEPDYKEWKIVVPKQTITAVTVDAITNECCDISSGEEYTVFPPEGYAHAGSSHSHNTIPAFFSGRDDDGELKVPGMHFVIGSITKDTYDIKASIVLNKIRYIISVQHVIDLTGLETLEKDLVTRVTDNQAEAFHENVHKYVSRPAPIVPQPVVFPGDGHNTRGPIDWRRPNKSQKRSQPTWNWLPKHRARDEDYGFDQFFVEQDDLERSRKADLERLVMLVTEMQEKGLENELFATMGLFGVIGMGDANKLVGGSLNNYLAEITEAIKTSRFT